MNRIISRTMRPFRSKRLTVIQRRKIGSNWYWENIDPKMRWTNTKLGRADPNTQMLLPMNNKYALMAQFKFMAPVYFGGLALWAYCDRTEPIWMDSSLFTYMEKEE
eukprot:290532_1